MLVLVLVSVNACAEGGVHMLAWKLTSIIIMYTICNEMSIMSTGKSIAETMAVQGLNVVLVSLPDKYLTETTESLKKRFPNLEFR